MENNQFTKIGTFCEKCGQVMCICKQYEEAEQWASKVIDETPKQWYIQLRGETKEVTEAEFNEAGITEFFNYSSLKIHYEEKKQTLILD